MEAWVGLLAAVAAGGVAYLAYNYFSSASSTTSSQITPITGAQYPIGQATPYETTGHLEDPLIAE
ncbi:MAG: hypothetical protein QXH07_07080, partial [Thermoplasmata archaeon]